MCVTPGARYCALGSSEPPPRSPGRATLAPTVQHTWPCAAGHLLPGPASRRAPRPPRLPGRPAARPLTLDQLVVVVLHRRALLGHGRRPLQPPPLQRRPRLRTASQQRAHRVRQLRAPLVRLIAARARAQLCVITARGAERLWMLLGADGGGGAPRADAAAAGGLEYREHRAGAAGRAGTGEAPGEGGGAARRSPDPARSMRACTPDPHPSAADEGQRSFRSGPCALSLPHLCHLYAVLPGPHGFLRSRRPPGPAVRSLPRKRSCGRRWRF